MKIAEYLCANPGANPGANLCGYSGENDPSNDRPSRAHGFSITELLVASTIGIFMITSTMSMYVANKNSYRLQQSISDTLKDSRFIIDRLQKKISSAGYSGFYSSYSDGTENTLNTPNNPLWDIAVPIFGYDNVSVSDIIAGITGITDGSDVLILKSMSSESGLLAQASSSSFTINAAAGYSTGNIVIVTDTDKASMFQIGSADDTAIPGETSVTLSAGNSPLPGNALLPTNLFENNATVGRLETLIYALKPGENGNTALFEGRLVTSADAAPVTALTEIIPNVEGMQFIYGIDTDGNESIDKYINATEVTATEWGQVHTIGISLLLMSEAKNVAIDNNSYSFDTDHFTFAKDATPSPSADKALRQIFTTYVTLKNI